MTAFANLNQLPKYSFKLPSNGKKIEYRPFTVGEQKKLMLAQADENLETIIGATSELISGCTFGKIDIANTPAFDVEFALLQIRARSIGETIEFGHACEKCQTTTVHRLGVEEVKVVGKADPCVKIAENLYIQFRYPTIAMAYDAKDSDDSLAQIALCVESVIVGDEVHDAKLESFESVVRFVETLTEKQLLEVKKFFDSIPKLIYEKKYVCQTCEHENSIKLEGIASFFTQ